MLHRIYFLLVVLLISAEIVSAQEFIAPNGAKKLENYRTSWLGNSFGGLENGRGKWVQQDIAAIAVTADGTVYTNVPWEEAGGNCSMYKDGQMLGSAGHTHGWGFNGGKAVAVNDKYVYIALAGENEGGNLVDENTWPTKGFRWFGVSRRLRSDFTKGAPFDGGKGGKGDTLPRSFLVINEVPEEKNHGEERAAVAGLCADNTNLYVANPHKSTIEVYDAETMKKKTEWNIPQEFGKDIRQIALDSADNLWVLLYRTQGSLLPEHFLVFDSNGKLFTKQLPNGKTSHCPIEIPESIEEFPFLPEAFCFDNQDRLLIAASDFADTILFLKKSKDNYKISSTLLGVIKFGDSGTFAEQTFCNITAVGADKQGNVYVASDRASSGGGTVLESYSFNGQTSGKTLDEMTDDDEILSQWKRNWCLFGLEFIDCAALDPEDETLAFTKEECFKLDYSQPAGKEAAFAGGTVVRSDSRWKTDENKEFFRDPRLHIKDSAGVWVRNLDGKRFLFVNDMNSVRIQVYGIEKTEDDLLGKAASFLRCWAVSLLSPRHIKDAADWLPGQPKQGEWIWRNSSSPDLLWKDFLPIDFLPEEFLMQEKEAPAIEGQWVDFNGDIWQATLKDGLRRFRFQGTDKNGCPVWNFENLDTFGHPAEFQQVKRIRYDAETDTLYLGGCAAVNGVEHKNQHWKPMGPVVCRYDHFLKGENPGKTDGKRRWQLVLPYITGSHGHESCEPMGFDIAGDYLFAPYTGASKKANFSTGHVEVYKIDDASSVGFMEPDTKTVGEIGLQDMRECLSAHRRSNGEYIIFLEDDYKAKVVMYRWAGTP